MVQHLQGKVALVTGATRGLGKGIAVGLGEAGATVYITGRSYDRSNLEDREIGGTLLDTQAAVEEAGGVCVPVQVDHSDDEQVRSLFDRIDNEQEGQLDLLVNNVFAGVQAIADAYGDPFWKQGPQLWDAVNQVGLRSHYVSSIFAARLMQRRQRGLICTISSWGGLSYIFGAAYGAGKSACDRLAADMAVELKPDNIASIAIWPGIVGTEQIARFADNTSAEGELDPQRTLMRDRYNWETPLLTGRAIAALAADAKVLRYSGKVQIVAELARRYKLVDQAGNRPASLRSLRFLLGAQFPALRDRDTLIPDLIVPWPLLLWGALQAPKT
jgi:NAD(P)-dependent dehydrogenase (short-subunit alcohol dehydrogenase family)